MIRNFAQHFEVYLSKTFDMNCKGSRHAY
ncbi:hypothetical protein SMG44B_60149 [Stenotrophomonas maltophilia]